MNLADELERLADLHDRGVLNDAEFQNAKQMVLSGTGPPTSVRLQRSLQYLRRSSRDAMFGGICAGLAQTTNLPVWVWRTVFVLLTLVVGIGMVLYLVLWALVPPDTIPEP